MATGEKGFWTHARREVVREMWPDHEVIAIAQYLDVTGSAVRGIAFRMNLPPRQTQMEWTEERVEELKRLRALRWGSSMICQYWGGSPSINSILDKIRELGLPIGRYRNLPDGFNVERIYSRLRERELPRLEMVEATHVVPKGRKLISLLDLNENTCRYSFGEPGKPGFGFCGKKPMKGKVWCPECWATAVAGVVDVRIPEKSESSSNPFEKRAKKFLSWRRQQNVVAA